MRLFGRMHVTALSSLNQGDQNVKQPSRKVLCHLIMQVGAPCGEGSGTEREVNIGHSTEG
jgi:hypothetical protein